MNLSPLRYMGGKNRGIKYIIPLFPKNIEEVVSPFFGGGSVELELAQKGISVYGGENYLPLTNFWQCLNLNPDKLASHVNSLYPCTKKQFINYQNILNEEVLIVEYDFLKAAQYYVVNRCSFSGSTMSGGMSINHPRFTLKSINNIRNFKIKNWNIINCDFEIILNKYNNIFAFIDPPYYLGKGSKLYGKNGSEHKNFDHERLAAVIKKHKHNWIMTYNNCEYIRNLYKEFETREVIWAYGANINKKSNEIIIVGKLYDNNL